MWVGFANNVVVSTLPVLLATFQAHLNRLYKHNGRCWYTGGSVDTSCYLCASEHRGIYLISVSHEEYRRGVIDEVAN